MITTWSVTSILIPGLLVLYTYLGYPALIALMARLRPRPVRTSSRSEVRVAVIVPSYNGEAFLPAKLDSLRRQTYPAQLQQWIFVLDGSSDGSQAFLQAQEDVTVLVNEQRSGKPTALNLARSALPADAEVVVLTDVRQALSRSAVADLVRTLADPQVGIAGGELVQVQIDGSAAPIGLYWRYEKSIRRNESRYFSTVGTSGALYALRASDFIELPADTILDDFEIPIRTLRRGLRTVLVDGAEALDQAEQKISGEWTRKVRTLTGNYQSLQRNPWLLNPIRNPAWLQYVSHKFLRLVAPWAMMALLAGSLLSGHPAWIAFGIAQLGFYLLAVAAIASPALSAKIRLAGVAGTFVALNAAAVVALLRFARGSYQVTWQQTRKR